MFKNLEKVMNLKKISNKDLAELLDVSNKTIRNKLSAKTAWTLPEIKKMGKFLFPEYKMDWLFATDEI